MMNDEHKVMLTGALILLTGIGLYSLRTMIVGNVVILISLMWRNKDVG